MELVKNGVVQLFEDGLFRDIHPSTKVKGKWVDTDISKESNDVKNFCAEQWTDEVKQAYKDHIDANLVVE
jgi:hypothetical protein